MKHSVVSFVYTGKYRLHDRRGASGRSKNIPLACHQPKTSEFKTRVGNGESIAAPAGNRAKQDNTDTG